MKKLIYLIIAAIPASLPINCGKVSVSVDDNTYQPKIVVEAYLFAGEPADNIRIMRNYGLNMKINIAELFIKDAQAYIKDLTTEQSYRLSFNPAKFAYGAPELIIESGKSYQITVAATIDGRGLFTSSNTMVPAQGFKIDKGASFLGPVQYDQAVKNDTKLRVVFIRSPGTASYISSITALDASPETFIETNIFGLEKDMIDEMSDLDEMKVFNQLKHQAQWTQTKLGGTEQSQLDIEWFSTWFYGRYRIIIYAADKNFSDFFLTHGFVQEMDGNLLEPKFHFEGDGIGVFGAAVRDTVYVELAK